MKAISLIDVGRDPTAVVRRARTTGKPVLLVDDAKPTAYLAEASEFEAMQAELKQPRRGQLLRDVADARAEIARAEGRVFEDVEELIADLHAAVDERAEQVGRPAE